MDAVLRAESLTRVFPSSGGDVVAVRDAEFAVQAGELVVIAGRSGAGKTTLLTMLGGLDRPTSGRVLIDGADLADPKTDVAALRGSRIASIFQTAGLIPVLSASENVEVPLRIRRVDPAERDRRVAEALRDVGLDEHARQRPGELSGGQQQRVGIARALVMQPGILLADEPTAQLDSETGAQIMDLIARLVHERGTAAVVATHDPAMLARADRVLELHDGELRRRSPRRDARRAALQSTSVFTDVPPPSFPTSP
ncbi:ABC transporter ATP-binding protein [Microbacterium esteraromaticum]|uniref:ABC transporter ATP-binding protein n=1 Tax=Microbacterium esteraromaticum TaxID=57043 RepID=UPI0019587C8C|nr:ABC transporter ATP-binding protein [Microbacterium esteraromaticum]MBM7467395.1 putative ABC transport system ATP-binding protein [Microbacterium esteraromaticum]